MLKGILLHGGYGTRLKPLTYTRPKQLLPIANIPMSQYGITSLKNAGITDIAIVIGGNNSYKVKEYYGDGEKFGVKITYIYQDEPKGISHAISLCEDFIGSHKFVVFLGDNIMLKDIVSYAKEFDNEGDAAKILLCEVSNPSQFGIADITKDGKIKKIMEKPKNPPTNLAVTGIYFLSPVIFDIIKKLKPSWRNELEITDALQILLESNQKISYDIITGYWKDTGTPDDIIEANRIILSSMAPYFHGQKENGVTIKGKVMIGKNTNIKNDTTIEGPVIIGENCIISGTTYIGPNTSIGNNSKLNNCTIDNSIIMDGCYIDGKISIANSIISHNSKITSNKQKKTILMLGEDTTIIL
ncbi:MAG: glucose-1-phosphate thymidylyltransferase [Nitrosopumilaceae archaeon]|nr:MAG: glucose-1-phosphate thymidylyltransferase [Nitrosopumilaceae archaeon]